MEDFIEKLIEKGFDEAIAKAFGNVIHENYQEKFLENTEKMSEEERKDVNESMHRFFSNLEKNYEIYKNENQTFLIQRIFFDKIVEEIAEKQKEIDSIEHSPIIIEIENGEIVWY